MSSTGVPAALLEERDDLRRVPPGRDVVDDARRCPAFNAVLWSVMSLSEEVESLDGIPGLTCGGVAANGENVPIEFWEVKGE